MATQDQPLIVSRHDEAPETLRARFQEWGYLFIKGGVDGIKCDRLRAAFLEELSPYVTEGSDANPVLSGDPFVETDPIWDEVYPRIQSLESFHQFFHDDQVLKLMETVTGTQPFVYPMKMARIATPRKIGYETPPHQDAHSHNAGPTMAGIWVALHSVSEGMGRLKVLPKSHTRGVRPVFESGGVGGVQCEIYPEETSWHVSDVDKGDVIIFHSCMVHRAEPNTAGERVRLSVDTRFCDYGAPVFSLNLDPHHGWRIEGLDWENIYRDWSPKAQRYYWQDYPNLF